MKWLALLSMFFCASAQADICKPKSNTFIPLNGLPMIKSGTTTTTEKNGVRVTRSEMTRAEPKYIRVHPSGKYVIVSLENGIAMLVDISDPKKPKISKTPLKNEAYPVEPNWEYISSPYSKAGMEYYRFEDILNQGESAKPAFSDFRHNQFYQSSAEYSDSTVERRHFRTLLFSTLSARDYVITKNGESVSAKPENLVYVCESVHKNLAQPILSKDGKFMATLELSEKDLATATDNTNGSDVNTGAMSSTTGIYKLEKDGSCEKTEDLGFATGKVSFSYPQEGKPDMLSFASSANFQSAESYNTSSVEATYLYNRETKQNQLISMPWVESEAQYPGFTKDGRVIYATKRGKQVGFVIYDPSQAELPTDKELKARKGPYARCFTAKSPNKPITPARATQ